MSAEDRLRDLLRSEASTIVPAGDGLARIQQRVARRRRVRTWLVPSAALVTGAAVAAVVLLAPDDPQKQTLTPGETPTVTATVPTATPAVPDDGGMPLDKPAIWPFTEQSQVSSSNPDYPYAQNSLEVGRHFVDDYLGLTGVQVSQACVSCGVLQLKVGSTQVGEITLLRLGVGFSTGDGREVYTVASVSGTDLTITSPTAGTAVGSPTHVTGRITGVHENVQLRLLTSSGDELATAGAPAGGEMPWSATLSWSRTDWTHGSLVGVTRSDKDGSVTRVVATPVTRDDVATPTTAVSFAGLVDGHVSLFDIATGKQIRQLTYPPSGKSDTFATWSYGTLAWVRTAGASACVYELDRLVGTKASTVASSTSVRYEWPVLSPSGSWLAWIETPCSGSTSGELVLTQDGAEVRRLALPSGSVANLYDVTDQGALLILTNDAQATGPGTIGLLPAGATTLDGKLLPLQPAAGCNLFSQAAFDGSAPVAFESCDTKVRLVRFTDKAARASADPSFSGEPPNSLSVRDGQYLVWLFGGDMLGAIATYADGAFTTLIDNARPNCSSIGDQKGCVRAPDW